MPILPINHIDTKPNGTPRLAGTGITLHVLLAIILKGEQPVSLVELAEDYNLTLGQIHAALSYYYDHQVEIEAHWEEEKQYEAIYKPASDESQRQMKERWEALQKSKESSLE